MSIKCVRNIDLKCDSRSYFYRPHTMSPPIIPQDSKEPALNHKLGLRILMYHNQAIDIDRSAIGRLSAFRNADKESLNIREDTVATLWLLLKAIDDLGYHRSILLSDGPQHKNFEGQLGKYLGLNEKELRNILDFWCDPIRSFLIDYVPPKDYKCDTEASAAPGEASSMLHRWGKYRAVVRQSARFRRKF